ncbi:hypothetical protein SAMN05443253_101436 [Bacillus sp. OK048]|nr:hypothetical protein SAMN05443253_101436 [Bacillus sp. OK048]
MSKTTHCDFFIKMAVLKVIVDFITMLIFAEGARLLENAIAFSSCVGRFEDVNQCPAGGRDRGDPAGALAPRRLPEPPAESEAPGAKINSLV